jgi:Homeodomain-like domain
MKKYIVRLEADERTQLEQLISAGKASAHRIRHANILLAVDESAQGPKLTDQIVAKTLHVSVRTIESIRQRLVLEGFQAALERKKRERPSVEKMFDGEKEAKLIAVACGSKPEGRVRWTMALLAERVVQLKIVESCSRETVRRTLKKTN